MRLGCPESEKLGKVEKDQERDRGCGWCCCVVCVCVKCLVFLGSWIFGSRELTLWLEKACSLDPLGYLMLGGHYHHHRRRRRRRLYTGYWMRLHTHTPQDLYPRS